MKHTHASVLSLVFVFVTSCGGQNRPDLPKEKIKSYGFNEKGVDTKYEYTDSNGERLLIQNSFPKSRINYTDPNGKKHNYAVFWTQIINETSNPVELMLDFPPDSFEFPRSSGNYMRLLVPSDTMTLDKVSLSEYGLPVKSFLDTGIHKSYFLKRTIDPKGSTAFYVVTISNHGSGGVLRTGLRLKGQNLFYTISAYKSTPGLPLMDKKEVTCGSINLKI